MTVSGVRSDKAALSSGCKPHPARYIDVEVHAVDRLDRQPDMIGQKLGDTAIITTAPVVRFCPSRASRPSIGPLETGVYQSWS